MIKAAQSTLADRWQRISDEWSRAQVEYRNQFDAERVNIAALRKAAQRMHDLEQQRYALTWELERLPQ